MAHSLTAWATAVSDLFPMSLDAEGVAAALDRVRSAIRQSGQDGKALSDLDPTHPALQDVAADLPRLQDQYEALRRLRPGGTAAALRAIDAADWLIWHDRHAAAFPDDEARRRHLVRVGGHILRGSRHAAPPQEPGLTPVPAAPPPPPARRTADAPPDDAPFPPTPPASGLEAAASQPTAQPMGQQAGVTLAPIGGDGAPGHAATLDRERAASPTIPAIPTAQAAGEGGTTPVPAPPERPDPTRSPPMVALPLDAPPRRSDDDPRHPAPIPLPPALPAPPATAATPALAPVIGRIGAVSPHAEAGRRDASPFGAGGFAPREPATVGRAAPWSAPPALSTPDPTGMAGVRSGGGVSQSPALPSPVKPQAGHAAAPLSSLPATPRATPPLTPAHPAPSNARAAEAAAGVAPSITRPVAASLGPSLPLPNAWSSPTRGVGALPAPRPDASLLSLAEGRAPVADSPTTPGDGGWRLGPAPARSEGNDREEGGPAPAVLPPPALLPTTRQPTPAPEQAARSGPLSGAIPFSDITVASSSTLDVISPSRAPQPAAPIGRAGVAALAAPTLSAPTLSAPKDHAPSPPRLEGPPVGTPIPGGDRNIRPQPAMDLSFRIDPLRIVHEGPNGEVLNVEHRTVAPIRPPQPWGVA